MNGEKWRQERGMGAPCHLLLGEDPCPPPLRLSEGRRKLPRRCPRPWLRWEGLPTLSSLTAPDLHAPFVRGARKGCPLLPPAVVRPVPSPSSWREEGGRDAPCPCPLERCLRLPLLQTFTLLIRRACSRFSLRESRNEGVFVAFVPLALLISARKMGGVAV